MIKYSRLFLTKQNLFYNGLTGRFFLSNFYDRFIENELEKKYEYLLILDFEATCEKKIKIEQEIIEFPCLKINLSNLKEEGRFHHYVRPVINPILSNFCVELTGILQEMVENEKTFGEVYELFEKWRLDEGLTEKNSLYVTSGDWDLGSMMPKQCKLSGILCPSHMRYWADIKKIYSVHTRIYCESFIKILKNYNMEFEGRHHSGIDDCLNIYQVAKKMIMSGAEFKPTSRLNLVKYMSAVQDKV